MYEFLFVVGLTAVFLVCAVVFVLFPKTLKALDKKLSDFINGSGVEAPRPGLHKQGCPAHDKGEVPVRGGYFFWDDSE